MQMNRLSTEQNAMSDQKQKFKKRKCFQKKYSML